MKDEKNSDPCHQLWDLARVAYWKWLSEPFQVSELTPYNRFRPERNRECGPHH